MKTLVVFGVCLILSIPCQARVIYVDTNTPNNNDGSNWANAYKFLQDALANASSSGDVNEIRVAQGVYKPDRCATEPNGSGDRQATFQLINGVTLNGGYAGLAGQDPNLRDANIYETILSGDLNGDDTAILNLREDSNRAENSYCIVTGADSTSVIDGFTITGGFCNDWSRTYWGRGGGGIYGGSQTIKNCKIIYNFASARGGGLYQCNGSIINCSFIGNQAFSLNGNLDSQDGGGAINSFWCFESGPTISNCTFIGNSSYQGGGLQCAYSSATLTNCKFIGNGAGWGNGINFQDTWTGILLRMTNCVFDGDQLHHLNGTNSIIKNCTFISNTAPVVSIRAGSSNIQIQDCIIWTEGSPIYIDSTSQDSTVTITYSDVQDGWPGEGNIDVDPCLADPNNGDYHLKSEAGRWDPTKQRWVYDEGTSLCIDAGDPNSSVGLEPNPNGDRINIGAYGGTIEASKSYCANPVDGDINGDCVVDFKDFAIMASHWLEDNR